MHTLMGVFCCVIYFCLLLSVEMCFFLVFYCDNLHQLLKSSWHLCLKEKISG